MSAAPATTTMNERSIDCETRDEVDFVKLNNNSNKNQTINTDQQTKVIENKEKEQKENNHKAKKQNEKNMETKTITTNATTAATPTTEHKKNSTKERLSLFSFSKKLSHKNQPQQVQANGGATPPPPTSNNNNNHIKNKEEGKNNDRAPATSTQTPFSFACQPPTVPIGTPPRQHRQFVKNSSSSLARLFSSTYNAKKFEKQEEKRLADAKKFHTYGGRRRSNGPYLERFKKAAKEDGDVALCTDAELKKGANSCSDQGTLTRKKRRTSGSCSELATLEPYEERHEDLGVRALRTLSRGLGKLWWKRSHSVEISTPDPEFKVAYLGNVLTGWAKGEGCVEKQLATLWRNYTQNNKPDVIMRVKVCASGLKATTRQHGLTEYWANRITHCCAPKNYPRVFCWIYRHEGRKLKHELRCHAVLCSKEKIVHEICDTLKENLECALREFKREKILKQNARLSLANAAYDNPSLPRRKILLSVGGNNYRPPLERSKSAPKLMAIEEAIGEEEGEEVEETNEPEMKPCCQRDSLYPAMTLGRRRCRRGHSIRRTGKARPCFGDSSKSCCGSENKSLCESPNAKGMASPSMVIPEEQHNNYGSNDSDDFEKLLKHNNYDSNASLATELLPYFDLQLNKNKSSSLSSLHELKEAIDSIDDGEPLSLLPTINSDPNADPEADFKLNDQAQQSLNEEQAEDDVVVGLRRPGICSDGEDDFLDDADDVDVRYFRQQSILNILHRNSMRKMAQLSLSSDENSSLETHTQTHTAPQYRHQLQSSISSNASSTATTEGSSSVNSGEPQRKQFQPDSDEGSISSGCETASTVTTPNQDDLSLQYCRHSNQQAAEQQFGLNGLPLHANSSDIGNESPVSAEEIYQRLEARLNGRNNSDATTFSSSSSITLKTSNSPTASAHDLVDDNLEVSNKSRAGHVARAVRRLRRASSAQCEKHDSDSECSDESGYVEFQEREKRNSKQDLRHKSVVTIPVSSSSPTKPQPPPKPMPRRHITGNSTTAV